MVQVLPGLGEELGPALENFSKGLEAIINPHLEFQKSMTKAIGQNPDLAQGLANLEYEAPGTLERLGFGKLGEVIRQIPESPEQAAARKKRGEIEQTASNKIDTAAAGSGLDLQRITNAVAYFKDKAKKGEPILADDALHILGLPSQSEQTVRDIQARRAKAEEPVVEDELALRQKALDNILANYPKLQNIDFINLARDYANGRTTPETNRMITSILSGELPGAKDAFLEAMKLHMTEKSEAFRMRLEQDRELAVLGREESNQERREGLTIQARAMEAWQRSGHAGSWQAWQTVMQDSDAISKVHEKANKDPASLTQDDRNILKVEEAEKFANFKQESYQSRSLDADIGRITAQLDKMQMQGAPESERSVQMVNLQQALDAKSEITGRRIIVHYGRVPEAGQTQEQAGTWFNKPRIWYSNADGKRIDDSEIYKGPEVPMPEGSNKLSDKAANIVGPLLQADPDKRAAGLKRLQQTQPAIYNEIVTKIPSLQP